MFFSFYDIAATLVSEKKCKKVTFYNVIDVILIPCRLEYTAFFHEIWWSRIDYNDFFYSAKKEVNDYMRTHPFTNLTLAKQMLYQPNEAGEEPVPFDSYTLIHEYFDT